MQIFSEWITQIILFILLGTIFELLLPDNHMKKYVNLILGLLLLLILSKPILYIYSVDVDAIMRPFQQMMEQDTSYLDSENEIEKQKKDIQAAQDAYIWKEVAAQLQHDANEHLPKKYGQEITGVRLEHDDDKEITAVYCSLKPADDTDSQIQKPVEPIEIETNEPLKEKKVKEAKDNQLTDYLSGIWELDQAIIFIEREEGNIDR